MAGLITDQQGIRIGVEAVGLVAGLDANEFAYRHSYLEEHHKLCQTLWVVEVDQSNRH
jgi:hypothetical protein